jgi:hypothetical protein
MTQTQNLQRSRLERLVAAYKLRLVDAAERLGAQPETWGHDKRISREEEERTLAAQGEYRLAPVPYPGLRPFDPQESDIFFGRERNVADVRKRLADERIVVVLGGSGSGKSSLLRAGLLPYLNTLQRIAGRDGNWYKAEFRPRLDPLGELVNSLVDQWLIPLHELEMPELSKEMGLQTNTSTEHAREQLRHQVRARLFDGGAPKPRESILAAVLDISGRQLDDYDRLASTGMRVPRPSLLLLLDQFEEVFRPEVPMDLRHAFLNLIVDLYRHLLDTRDSGGLFLAITMRSEELHHCAEHPGLSDVVNRSFYLLDLLDSDNPQDRRDLRRAILQPARNVFNDWGLEYDNGNPDAPFERGMVDWLLAGAKLSSKDRPDELPLLQHALQATWHAAIRRWWATEFKNIPPTIERGDLPGQIVSDWQEPDLGSCLKVRADKAAERAVQRFAEAAGEDIAEAGEAALQATFRALARRNDRGAWARRFANPEDIRSFMDADPILAGSKMSVPKSCEALRQALHVFVLRGYLSGGGLQPYDISHEALIRNWPKFREWLREPEEVTYALIRILTEADPKQLLKGTDAKLRQLIPSDVANRITMVGPHGRLPISWAEDQITATLENATIRRRWGDKERALQTLLSLAAAANNARQQAALAQRKAELDKQRAEDEAKAAEILNKRDLEHLRELAVRRRAWLITAILCALIAFATAVIATNRYLVAEKAYTIASISEAAARSSYMDVEIQNLRRVVDSQVTDILAIKRDLQRDAERASILKEKQEDQVKEADEHWQNAVNEIGNLQRMFQRSQPSLKSENERQWRMISRAEKRNIITKIEELFTKDRSNSAKKLRVALYAVAAIPETNDRLNAVLRQTISYNYRRVAYFHPPGSQKVWGLAINPRNPHQVAIGDDNGAIWMWDPLESSPQRSDYFTAEDGIVNGLAFNETGTLFVAAYRGAGAVIFDPASQNVYCRLRPNSGPSGAYSVAWVGTRVAVASNDDKVHLWDVSDKGCIEVVDHEYQFDDVVFGVAISPDGALLAGASGDGKVKVWRTELPMKPLHVFPDDDAIVPPRQPMFAVAFRPDGKVLAATGADGKGYLWNMETWERIELSSGGGTVGNISFSPNTKYVVATARANGNAIISDATTGRRVGEAGFSEEDTTRLFGVSFTSDSNYLLTGTLDGLANAWILGQNNVKATDRDSLIAIGRDRIGIKYLEPDECRILRDIRIPIYEAAEHNWREKDPEGRLCLLPFLGQ